MLPRLKLFGNYFVTDKLVKPTIKGIKEGRDELLDEAIKLINRKYK